MHHHYLDAPWGGENLVLPNNELHVIPTNDDRPHVVDMAHTCWCVVTIDPEDEGYIIRHNAADGREAFETYQRIPS